MIDRILTVGGITLVSRVTGFLRDILLAAVLGAGPVADAFFVALRLPNHFRAIFAEGAFNAAFIPAYARVRIASGADAVRLFSDRVFTLLLISQVVLLGVALFFTPGVIDLLAPGFSKDPGRFTLAVELTRITFPLSAAGQPRHALRRHPQRVGSLRRRRGGADPAQPFDDADLGVRGTLRDRRPRRRLGRAAGGISRSSCWSAAMPPGRACCRGWPGRSSTGR